MFNIIYEKQQEKKELKFPLIAKNTKSGTIILCLTNNDGVVINKGESSARYVGEVGDIWVDVRNSDTWQILHEDVQINLVVKEQA